jgi:hypothetical protein
VCQSVYGQDKGTTIEEYNYLTKGYKIQVESGLDMKKGYVLTDLVSSEATNTFNKSSMTFKGLYREGQQTPCAVLCIIDKAYICIPHFESSDDLWKLYFSATLSLTDFQKLAILKGLGRSVAFFAKNN